MKKRILSIVLCMALCLGMASSLAGCGGKADAFVNPDEWGKYCLWAKENMYKMMEEEK